VQRRWREGIPSSVIKSASNTEPAQPVPVTTGVVKVQEFANSRDSILDQSG
jgi:hypothetical protein